MRRILTLFGLCLLPACGSAGGTPDVARPSSGDARIDDAAREPIDDGTTPAQRDLTLIGRGMAAYQGRVLQVRLVEETGNLVIGHGIVGALDGPDLELRMPDLVGTGDYHVDVFVDGNGNGRYDGPGTDPS
jgi:hypothetical protein